MNTAHITKMLHRSESTHKPVVRLLMVYEDKGERFSFIVSPHKESDVTRIVRTLKWAGLHGVEVTFRPI